MWMLLHRRHASLSSGNRALARCSGLSDASKTSTASLDRKSTRLNSSHANISYAVFCLKKKKRQHKISLHWLAVAGCKKSNSLTPQTASPQRWFAAHQRHSATVPVSVSPQYTVAFNNLH